MKNVLNTVKTFWTENVVPFISNPIVAFVLGVICGAVHRDLGL